MKTLTLVQCKPAKDYVNFQTYKIKWNMLVNDISEMCCEKYSNVTNVNLNDTEMFLWRQLVFNLVNNKSYTFYVGIDINGESVNFNFCKFADFEHYASVNTLDELVDVIMQNIIYEK